MHINESTHVVGFLADCLFPSLCSDKYITLNGEKGWGALLTLTDI